MKQKVIEKKIKDLRSLAGKNITQFHRLLDVLPAGAYMCDASGLITYFNARAETVWGRAPKINDSVDRYCGSFKMYHLDGSPITHDRCWMARALKEKKEYNGREIMIERPDGTRVIGLAHANPIYDADGDMIGAVNVLVDITEQKMAEDSIRQSKQEMDDFFDTAIVGLHFVGPDGTILRANRAELELLGYTKEEYIGRNVAEVHADKEVIEDILARLTRGEKLDNYEARLKCKDGSIKYVLISSSVLWKDGKFMYTRCFTRDITDRKLAEDALKESARKKDEFLATLSHELRNPLAPIRNAVEILNLKPLPSDMRWLVQMIDRQTHQMIRLVEDLLDVSRITSNKLQLKNEEVELSEVLQLAIETSNTMIQNAGHELIVHIPPKPILLYGDRIRLAQIVTNLLNNSAKYTDNGGRIWLTAAIEEGDLVLSVKDNGVGIDPKMLSHIFEIFMQARDKRSAYYSESGLGIGLTLVKRLVELHGGTVEAHSDGAGAGSTFTVRLPVAVRSSCGVSRGSIGADPDTMMRRVLVVDDNMDVAASMGEILKMMQNEVVIAYDGTRAVQVAEKFKPHVILLDIGLPKMNGYEVAKMIRRTEWGKHVTLIACTGWGEKTDKDRSKEVGFDHHLVKPVDMNELKKSLGECSVSIRSTQDEKI